MHACISLNKNILAISRYIARLTIIIIILAPKCLNGQVQRDTLDQFLQYCYNGEWRLICYVESGWNAVRTTATCKQLGYSSGEGEVIFEH